MADWNWADHGTSQDLSDLLPGDPVSALVPTSQHGGNQVWNQAHAMTAPGGASGDLGNDLGEAVVVSPPAIEDSNKDTIPPGTSGKPQASGQQGSRPQPRPAWGPSATPDVLRKPAG